MFTPSHCKDKPILGLGNLDKFKVAATQDVAEKYPQYHAAWVAFCRHVDSSTLNSNNRLFLLKCAFDCINEKTDTNDFAKLLTTAQYLHESFGEQVFYHLFSKRVKPESRLLSHYVTASQLLNDLQETDGLVNIIKQSMPNLEGLVQSLEEKQANYLDEKFPKTNLDQVIERFAEKNNLVEFPLSNEVLAQLKDEYSAISLLMPQLHKLPIADLKMKAQQASTEWTETNNIKAKLTLVAIIAEQIRRHYKIVPNDTQMLALLAILNTPPHLKGQIAQIKTGEGKSTIIAMLAAFEGCLGKNVDIVTSSPSLAVRDFEKYEPFFKSLGLDSAHICDENPDPEQFNARILYGTNTDYEFAQLNEKLYCNGARKNREFGTVIVDEVDNLFLDTALNSAIIAIPGSDNLTWIYPPILSFINGNIKQTSISQLKDYLIKTLHEKYHDQINQISDNQYKRWIISAKEALLVKQHKKDYVVKKTSTGFDIVIVDYHNTGRLNEGSQWQNGLHQFLQAKHQLKITPESISAASLSHPTYFTQYQHIIGLTGTMGESVERDEIQRIYNVDSFDVPPHHPSLRVKHPACLEASEEAQFAAILEKARSVKNEGRPVLILMKTIVASEQLAEYFTKAGLTPQLLNLTQREDENYLIGQAGEAGKITIATNAAGRGTDIILSPASKAAGGLSFIFGFYPQNSRVEAQGDGRSARQGQPGDCQMILNEQDDYIVSLRKKAITNLGQYLESVTSWSLMNADEKLEFLNHLRSSLIKIESEQRYLACKKEELYFEKLNVFFERNIALHQTVKNDALITSLSQTCESAHLFPLSKLTLDQSELMKVFNPLQDTIDTLMSSQLQGIKVDWTVLIKQYKEMIIGQYQKIWADFYDALHKNDHHTSLNEVKQEINSRYQVVDKNLNLIDSNPHENMNTILNALLSASLRRLLEHEGIAHLTDNESLNTEQSDDVSPLFLALQHRKPILVNRLIGSGAVLDVPLPDGWRTLDLDSLIKEASRAYHRQSYDHYWNLKNYHQAKMLSKRALLLDPTYTQAHMLQYWCTLLLDGNNACLEPLEKTVKELPHNDKLIAFLGSHYQEFHRNFAQAIEYYNEAIRLNPKAHKHYYHRARAYILLENHAKALEDITLAIQLEAAQSHNPDSTDHLDWGRDADYYYWRSKIHIELKEYTKALSDMHEYQRRKPLEFENNFLGKAILTMLEEKESQQIKLETKSVTSYLHTNYGLFSPPDTIDNPSSALKIAFKS